VNYPQYPQTDDNTLDSHTENFAESLAPLTDDEIALWEEAL